MSLYDDLAAAIRGEAPAALATVIEGPGRGAKLLVRPGVEAAGSLGDPDLDRVVARDALGQLAAGHTGIRHYGQHGEAREAAVTVFVESFAPPPRMLIFGAVDFTAALVRVAKVLGYRVVVCDAREVFATKVRFPHADEVVVDWPDRLLGRIGAELTPRDAVCVLTHDAKFDVPALVAALGTEAGYIGAMGSRRTHDERVRRLQEAGVDAAGLARVRAPIGLDLGARTPEETAVSICAEIIADRTGRRDPRPLSQTTGPIHQSKPFLPPNVPPWRNVRGQERGEPAVVLLAAGEGSRFAGPGHKLLAPFGESTVVECAIRNAVAAGIGPVYVVVGAVDIPVPEGVQVVRNPDWTAGMATSLSAAAAAAAEAGHAAMVVGLGDQPLVSPEAWRRVAQGDTPITVASYGDDGVRGHPVRLAAEIWPLLPTTGDVGARPVMQEHPDLVAEVPCPGSAVDIDTAEDLSRWS